MTRRYGGDTPPAHEIPVYTGRPRLEEWLRRYMGHCVDDVLTPRAYMEDFLPLNFWQWLFELEQKHERIKPKKTQGEWDWAYALRLGIHATKFVNLPANQQRYIVKARQHEPPIWWRGDDFPDFERVVKESMHFFSLTPEGKVSYKKNIMKQVVYVRNGF